MDISFIYETAYVIFHSLLDFSQLVVGFFMTTFNDLVPVGLRPLTDPILNALGIGNISILSFVLGAGIAVYLAYQLATWILNIVT